MRRDVWKGREIQTTIYYTINAKGDGNLREKEGVKGRGEGEVELRALGSERLNWKVGIY